MGCVKTEFNAPYYLHRRLAETSEQEGVSLNQYIVSLLSAIALINGKAILVNFQMIYKYSKNTSGTNLNSPDLKREISIHNALCLCVCDSEKTKLSS